MGRTIWYELHSPRDLTWDEWKEIRAAVALMNHCGSWSCEDLSLDPPSPRDSVVRRPPANEIDVVANGFTKVGGDEWNAALVVAFATWLSRRFSFGYVRIADEGDYLIGPARILRDGAFTPELDLKRIAKHREYLRTNGGEEYLAAFDAKLAAAQTGQLFNIVPVLEYREVAEIAALGLSDDELRSLTVADVVKRIRVPWFDSNVGAA